MQQSVYSAGGEKKDPVHSIFADKREKMRVTGVTDVSTFDEERAVIRTDMGLLTVRGQGLKLKELDGGGGELEITGRIDGIFYTSGPQKSGFLAGLFR